MKIIVFLHICGVIIVLGAGQALAVTPGLIDDFMAPGTNSWSGGAALSNPGSGGVDGAGDGFLLISRTPFSGNLGARSANPSYLGDWIAAGITSVELMISDVGADEDLEVHFLISDADNFTADIWQFNTGFDPPADGSWGQYTIDDLSDSSKWTRTKGSATLESVLQNVALMHLRHDLAPYVSSPDIIVGDIGLDNVTLVAAQPGDFNNDSAVDDLDIDLRRMAIAASDPDPIFNVNGDEGLDDVDFEHLITVILKTGSGDGDLNRLVNFSDFVTVANNFGNSGTG